MSEEIGKLPELGDHDNSTRKKNDCSQGCGVGKQRFGAPKLSRSVRLDLSLLCSVFYLCFSCTLHK